MNNTSALGAIARRWWILLLLGVVGAALAALPETERVEEQITRSFTATHTMLVNNTDAISAATGVSPNQVALLATTGEVPRRVAESIDYSGNSAELASNVVVDFDFSTGALTFTTTQDSAGEAELVADSFAEVTNSYLAERQDVVYQERLAAALDRLETLENDLDDRTAQLGSDPDNPALKAQRDAISRQYSVAFEQSQTLAAAPPVLGFTTLQRAQAVEITKSTGIDTPTSRPTRAMMGLAAGLALGVGAALLLGRLDRRIRTREQAEEVLGLRARVIIPTASDGKVGGLVVVSGRHDPLSDSYRTLRNVVSFVQSGLKPVDRGLVTLVVSPGPGDGKTSTSANLAAAFLESGQRTIVVNTDFRRPRLAAAISETPPSRLPFALEELDAFGTRSFLLPTELNGLMMMDLSTIDASPGELARATAHHVKKLSQQGHSIVIDTSPVGATAEVLDLVPLADVIVVVTRVGHTSIEAASRTMSMLRDLTTAPMVLALGGLKEAKTPYYHYTDHQKADQEAKTERTGVRKRFRRDHEPA